MTDAASALPVTLALASELLAATTSATILRIEQELTEMLRELGLPCKPAVELIELDPKCAGSLVRLRVAGSSCRFPLLTIFEALAYIQAIPLIKPVMRPDGELEELRGLAPALLGELLGLVCRSSISARPDILMPYNPLQHALKLGMSIAGRDVAAASTSLCGEEAIEQLLVELAGKTVDILIEPAYLRELTSLRGSAGDRQEATQQRPRRLRGTRVIDPDYLRFDPHISIAEGFAIAREGLFVELGLALPPLHFCPDPSLRKAGFAFQINNVRTMPQIGLDAGCIFVDDTADSLAVLGIDAKPTINPQTHRPCSVTSSVHRELLEATNRFTWDSLGYLILVFAAAVRRSAHALMTQKLATSMVDKVGSAFPAFKDAAEVYLPSQRLAPILRELLRDGVSVRDLPRILQVLLVYETVPEASRGMDRISFVRSELADLITFKVAGGANTIDVYLLDHELEDALADPVAEMISEELADSISAALKAELSLLVLTVRSPALLTREELRRPLSALLRAEFPQLTVLSYDEVPRHYIVQPVGRISFSRIGHP